MQFDADDLTSIRNLLDITLMLYEQGFKVDKDSHMATVLELILMEAQGLVDNYCVVSPQD